LRDRFRIRTRRQGEAAGHGAAVEVVPEEGSGSSDEIVR